MKNPPLTTREQEILDLVAQGSDNKEIAKILNISEKTISKWETGRGFPEQTIIPTLAKELNVSIGELFSQTKIENKNLSNNIQRMGFYVSGDA